MANTFNHNDKVVITDGGNVGIGTTSPNQKLEVVSSNANTATFRNSIGQQTVTFGGTANTAFSDLILKTNSGQGEIWKAGTGYTSYGGASALNIYNSNGAIAFHPNGSVNAMFIATNTNVGIGTTSPSAKLTIDSSSTPQLLLRNPSGTNSQILLEDNGGGTQNASITFDQAGQNTLTIATGYQSTTDDNKIHIAPAGYIGLTVRGGTGSNNGNVGIGTTSPYEKLDIAGNIRLGNYTDAGTKYIGYGNNTFANQFIAGMSIESTTLGGNYSQRLNFATHHYGVFAGVRMTLDEQGRLGIGTTSPSYKLQVAEPDYARISLHQTTTGGIWQWGNDGSNMYAYYTNTGVRAIDITNSGNVGIGTTSPSKKLDVRGGYFITSDGGTNQQAFVQGGNGYAYFGNYSTGKAAFGNSEDWTTLVADGGNVGIGTTSPETKLHVNGTQYISGDLRIGSSFGATNQTSIFKNQGSSGLGIFTWGDTAPVVIGGGHVIIRSEAGANRNLYVTGNVGIGTTSSAAKLEIAGTSGNVKIGDASGYNGISLNGTLDIANYNILSRASDKSLYINRPSGNNIYFREQNSDQVFIKSGGNVGIGTTSPGAKLSVEVAGTADVIKFTRDAGVNGEMTFDFTGANSNFYSAQGGFTFSGSSSSYGVNFTSGGNVGIGTTSPGYPLDVNGVARGTAFYAVNDRNQFTRGFVRLTSASNNTSVLDISVEDSITSIYSNYFSGGADQPIRIGTYANLANQLYLATSGNVGIGTTSPAQKLHVSSASAVFQLTDTNKTANDSLWIQALSQTSWGIGTASSSATGTKITITDSGNVGIGTTSPGELLDVRGNIRFGTGGTSAWGEGLLTMNSGWGTYKYPTIGSYDGSVGSLIMFHNPHVPFRTDNAVSTSYTGRAGLRMAIDTAATGYWDMGLAGDFFHIYRGNSGEFVRITNTGNVGIGTTSPGAKLTVGTQSSGQSGTGNSSDNSIIARIGASQAAGRVYALTLANTASAAVGNDASLSFVTTSTWSATGVISVIARNTSYAYSDMAFSLYNGSVNAERMRIVGETGNVGIGTTSPAYKIDVSGGAIAIRGNTAGNSLRFDDTTSTSRNAMYVDTSNYLNVGNSNYAGIKLYHTASAPQANGLEGNQIAEGYGTTENGKVLAEPTAWLAVRVGTTDYAIPMYSVG